MPELPEVEIVKRALEPALSGKKISRIQFNRPNLRLPLPPSLPDNLKNQRIQTVQRRGKYIIALAANDHGFILHLGMSGVIRIQPPATNHAPQKHDHVEIHIKDNTRIIFNDPRRFGFFDAITTQNWQSYTGIAKMGPEPLGNSFNAQTLLSSLSKRKTHVKVALLDQSIIAGIGNIYACEALYMSKINPLTPANTLSLEQCETLSTAIKATLTKAINAGGSSLKDYKHTDGKLGYFQHQFTVYNQESTPCPDCTCDLKATGGIKRIIQAGRSTFYCPQKQK